MSCARSTRRWRRQSRAIRNPCRGRQMLSSGLGDLAGKYQFVLAKPRLDFHSLQPGGAATAAIRAAAAKLPFVQSGAAHVRITGPVALADTQFATVAKGTVTGLIGSVALITLVAHPRGRKLAADRADPRDTWPWADADAAVRGNGDRHA